MAQPSAIADKGPMGVGGPAPDRDFDGLPEPGGPHAAATVKPAGAGSADDLIAQLAGQEIDRLLAAEADGAAEPPSTRVHATNVAPEVRDASNGRADEQLIAADDSEIVVQALSVVGAAPESVPETMRLADPSTAAALTAVLDEIHDAPAVPESHPAAPEPAAEEIDHAAITTLLDGRGPREGSTRGPRTGPPLLLRPLLWINSPVTNASPHVRDVVGKIAIVTLANAVAILLYVVIFGHPR